MARETFSPRDVRFTLAVAVLIAVCALYVRAEYSKAFPQASIHLKLSPAGITAAASDYLRSQSLPTAGFRQLTVFDPDEEARLYLEREVGLERANQLMQRDVPVWRWRARWFRPPAKEELLVRLSPDGRITGFEHIVEETAAGARPSHEEALAMARSAVSAFTPAPGRLVEDRLERRPNRYDYLFTWEQDGFRAKDATYRRTVVMHGDRLGRYAEYLYVPEGWRRDFAGMRSRNELYSTIAQALWAPLLTGALILIVQSLRRGRIPWRPLIQISGVVGLLQIANQLNALPLLVDSFPTSSPYLQTLLLVVLQSLGAGVAVFFYVIVAGASGEPLYRALTADPLSLRTAFTPAGLSTRRFFRATVAGYGLAAAHFAFLVAFYLIGRRFGAWSPQDVQYSDLLSTALPWIYPIAIAAMASASEEFWFRLLAIPLLFRFLRVRWLAAIIPAFVWGFLHANYPQQPAWIRGVEVGLIGVAAGLVMLRFGIVATLVWHYAIDALLIGLNLFDSPAWYYRISAAILLLAVAAPLIVSVVLYGRHRGFVALETSEPPEQDTSREAEAAPVERGPYIRPAWNIRWLYIAAAVAAAAGFAVSPEVFGNWIRIRVTRTQAEAIARARLPQSARWQSTTDFIANLDTSEFEYLRRAVGSDAAQRAVREHKPVAVWRTRFFRPLEKEERIFYVDQSGQVIRTDHLLDERAPGARLTAAEARARAAKLMPPSGTLLVDGSEQSRENRTDHSFVFEDPQAQWKDARARFSVELHGDEPSNFRRFLKIPEDWLREFRKPALRDFAVPALLGSTALPLLLIFMRRLASHDTRLHWRTYSSIAGAALLCAVAGGINQWASGMSGYDTAVPLQNYIMQYAIGRGMSALVMAGALFTLVMALDVFRQAAIGNAALNPPSLARTMAIAVLITGAARFSGWLRSTVPGPHRSAPVWSVAGLDTCLPGVQPLTQAFMVAVVAVSAAGILGFAGVRFMRPRRRIIAAALLSFAIAFSRSLTAQDFAVTALLSAGWLALLLLIIRTCAADLTGYSVAAFWITALGSAYEMMLQPAAFLRWNGVAAAAMAALAGVALIVTQRREAPSPLSP